MRPGPSIASYKGDLYEHKINSTLQRQKLKHILDSIKRGVTRPPPCPSNLTSPPLGPSWSDCKQSHGGVPPNVSTGACFSFLFSPLDPASSPHHLIIASVGGSEPASLILLCSFPFPTDAVGSARAPPLQQNTPKINVC
jgi:hypothetical protein